MNQKLRIYESVSPGADIGRFNASADRLAATGIVIRRSVCRTPSDLDPDGEALDLFLERGESALPITEYEGAVIWDGSYPDDQTLADFLDVSDGILSVNRQQPPSFNDLAPACECGPKR